MADEYTLDEYSRDDLVGMFRIRAGFNTRFEEATILQLFDYAQLHYERTGEGRLPPPWFRFHFTDMTLPAGEISVPVPYDFLSFAEEWPVYIMVGGARKELGIVPPTDMPAVITQGVPVCAAFDGVRLWADKEALVEHLITFHYFRRLSKLSVDPDSLWFKHFPLLILERALLSYYMSTKNVESIRMSMLKEYEDDYLVRCVSMRESLVSRYKGRN